MKAKRVVIAAAGVLLYGVLGLWAVEIKLDYQKVVPGMVFCLAGALFMAMIIANNPRLFLRAWGAVALGLFGSFMQNYLAERDMRLIAPLDIVLFPVGGFLLGTLLGELTYRLLRRVNVWR